MRKKCYYNNILHSIFINDKHFSRFYFLCLILGKRFGSPAPKQNLPVSTTRYYVILERPLTLRERHSADYSPDASCASYKKTVRNIVNQVLMCEE